MADGEQVAWIVMGMVVAFVVGVFAGFVLEANAEEREVHAELCPALLTHSPTIADSLAVIEAHHGCWTFVHPEAP